MRERIASCRQIRCASSHHAMGKEPAFAAEYCDRAFSHRSCVCRFDLKDITGPDRGDHAASLHADAHLSHVAQQIFDE